MSNVIDIRTRRPLGETPRKPWLTMPDWPPPPPPRYRRPVVLVAVDIDPPIETVCVAAVPFASEVTP